MTLPRIQCEDCKFGPSLIWDDLEESPVGDFDCSEYPKGIPSFVEEGTGDCPRFQPKESNNV